MLLPLLLPRTTADEKGPRPITLVRCHPQQQRQPAGSTSATWTACKAAIHSAARINSRHESELASRCIGVSGSRLGHRQSCIQNNKQPQRPSLTNRPGCTSKASPGKARPAGSTCTAIYVTRQTNPTRAHAAPVPFFFPGVWLPRPLALHRGASDSNTPPHTS